MRATALFSCVLVALAATQASAAFDLQVTEIWPGNEPGENLTADWFEVTNLGDMAWTDADGSLYFDDDSADPEAADLISGVTSIAAGESVVFIDADDTVEFEAVWGSTIDGVQLGVYAGSGMSQGGDGATLFVSNGQPLLDFSNVVSVDLQEYPDANATGGQSWDVQLGAFSVVGDAAGAFSSVLANDEGQYGIGSPGASVPEPTAAVMLLAGFLATGAARSRR